MISSHPEAPAASQLLRALFIGIIFHAVHSKTGCGPKHELDTFQARDSLVSPFGTCGSGGPGSQGGPPPGWAWHGPGLLRPPAPVEESCTEHQGAPWPPLHPHSYCFGVFAIASWFLFASPGSSPWRLPLPLLCCAWGRCLEPPPLGNPFTGHESGAHEEVSPLAPSCRGWKEGPGSDLQLVSTSGSTEGACRAGSAAAYKTSLPARGHGVLAEGRSCS